MTVVVEILDIATIKTLLVGIPESIGLLIFGIGLAATAILIRWLLGRDDTEKTEEELRK